jgi:UDP:flavonoid glycosyltransferase YjiC (YdhE family)
LVNSAIGFEFHHALSPNIKYIGPLIPRLYGGKLSRQVTRFLNGSVSLQSRPVIAIFTDSYSMASMDPDQIIALANGLVNAKVRVLWALPITQRIFLPSRLGLSFKLVSKLNYLNVLRHSNVKMTISNCGLASVQESLYFTKPVLCIPVIADQFDVASRLEDSGAGLQVSNQTFSSAEITNLVGILLNEQTFHSNASRISTLFRKMGGIKDVVSEINSKASITSTLLSSKANTPELQETNITSILALIICISIYFFLKISNRSRKTL